MAYIDLEKQLPWLPRKSMVKLIDAHAEATLIGDLTRLGFHVVVIECSGIVDRTSFFQVIKETLGFYDYYGGGWNGFDDLFPEYLEARGVPVALIWRNAQHLLGANLYLLMESAIILDGYEVMQPPEARLPQFATFWLGPRELGFTARPEGNGDPA